MGHINTTSKLLKAGFLYGAASILLVALIIYGGINMSEVLNIEELRAKSVQELTIPGFIDGETITVKVQKPRLMVMMAQGKIPNPLMGAVTKLMKGQGNAKDADMSEMAKVFEFYCKTCMVEPKYDDIADIITDDQMMFIFNWAMGGVQGLESFRPNQENGTGDNTGKGVQ